MIITSSQQLEDLTNPSNALNIEEFEEITMKFGSFVCICKGKKMNFLNFLKFLIDDKRTQKIYFALLGEHNFQSIIKAYLNSTPNVYKKIFRSKLNKK
jgi:uncharacterized protein YfbU (UPF0304 family)